MHVKGWLLKCFAMTDTCKHRLSKLSRRLLIRQLSRCVVPGAAGAKLVRPGTRGAKLPAEDLPHTFHTSNLDSIVIVNIVIFLMI